MAAVSMGVTAAVAVGSKNGIVKVGRLVASGTDVASGVALAGSEGGVGLPTESGKYEQAKLSKTKMDIVSISLRWFVYIFPREFVLTKDSAGKRH